MIRIVITLFFLFSVLVGFSQNEIDAKTVRARKYLILDNDADRTSSTADSIIGFINGSDTATLIPIPTGGGGSDTSYFDYVEPVLSTKSEIERTVFEDTVYVQGTNPYLYSDGNMRAQGNLQIDGTATIDDELEVGEDLRVGGSAATSEILFQNLPIKTRDSVLYISNDTVYKGAFSGGGGTSYWELLGGGAELNPVSGVDTVNMESEVVQVDGVTLFTDPHNATNVMIGDGAGVNSSTHGDGNIGIGETALRNLTTGRYNIGIGRDAGRQITTSLYSTILGYNAGRIVSGNRSVFIGAFAGTDETSANTIIIDNFDRGSEVNGRNYAPFYAVTDATPADNMTYIGGSGTTQVNGYFQITELPLLDSDTTLVMSNDSIGYAIGGGASSPWTSSGDYIYQSTLTDSVGIGTNTPEALFDVDGHANIEGAFTLKSGQIEDSDATPDVSGANIFVYAGGTTVTVTDLDNPRSGTIYYIIGSSDTHTLTINDSGNFALSGNITLGFRDVLVLICTQDNLYMEVSRSDN